MIKYTSVLFLFVIFSQEHSLAQKRFRDEVFAVIDSSVNVQYGQAVNIKGDNETLLLDVLYPPKGDTIKYRPLLIFIHGGGFQNNSKNGNFSSMICESFAKRGYVTATIDYRLGVEKSGLDAEGKKEKTNDDYANALYRAQQDGKAAIRFFRKNAELYGIDTSQIFITGSSAGSKTCLAIAYMDENEIPTSVNKKKWGNLEGNSGNEGYSSRVSGVLNNWGALIDYKWIQRGDVPLFNTAGTEDKTVPYDSSYDYHGFKYGPYILFQHCLSLGIPTGWRPFYGTGHTLDNKKIKQDSCVQSMAAWLYTQLKINKGKNEEGVFRWEKDINAFDSLNLAEKHTADAILFIGSSNIRRWKTIREDIGYSDIMLRAFGGSNMNDVCYYLDRIIKPHQPKAVFFYVGNDIGATEKDKAPDQVLEFYKIAVQTVRNRFPDIPIVWLAINPSEKRWSVWNNICQANSLIRAYTESTKGLYFIDIGKSFLKDDGKPDPIFFTDDKVHFNEKGYKLWGNTISDSVRKITKGKL